MSIQHLKEKIITFFKVHLWDESFEIANQRVNFTLRMLRIVTIVLKGFYQHECFSRAMTLTYMTLLSITPLLAILFAVLSFLASENSSDIEKYLNDLFAPAKGGDANEFVMKIMQIVKSVNIEQITWFGYFFLILSAISLISGLENSFNKIWSVHRGRSLLRKFGSYTLILIVLPFFITISISLSTNYQQYTLQQMTGFENVLEHFKGYFYFLDFMLSVSGYAVHHISVAFSHLLQFLFSWLILVILYYYLPFTKVKLLDSMKGGVIAAILLELAKPVFTGYVSYFVNSSTIEKVYGALSFIPISLLWLYIVWLIILLGAEFTRSFQNVETYQNEIRLSKLNRKSRDLLVLKMVKEILLRQKIQKYYTIEELSNRFQVPFYFTDTTFDLLEKANISKENKQNNLLQIIKEDVTPAEIILALWSTGQEMAFSRIQSPELDSFFERYEELLLEKKEKFNV